MPYKTRRCSVKGCPSTSLNHKQFHHFPKEAERSRTWTRLCGNESLLGIPAAEMHKKYHVCSLHFSREQYFNNEQLRLRFYLGGAVPDQLLGDPLSEELIECWWKAGRLEEFYREPVHQSCRKSKYDVSDISGMTPLPTLSGSNNAGMSGCQEEVVLFDTLDQNKPESCASECVDEGFAPMEYLDHLRSHNDLNHQPLLSQTNPTVTLKLNTSEANLTPAPINSGSNVGTSHYEENLLLLEASDQSLKNGSPYSLKKSSVEHANAPGTWGSLLKGVEAPCTLDSSSEDSDSPCKLDSPFRHFDEGFAPMEYLDYVDYNKSGPTPYRTKCHIGALTLSDFKTEKRAERSLGMVKSKFKQMQHQNRQLQQKLKQAQNKIKKLQLMLLASARKDSDQK